MLALVGRCGALPPSLQATKVTTKNVVLPGIKELTSVAGKTKDDLASMLALLTKKYSFTQLNCEI